MRAGLRCVAAVIGAWLLAVAPGWAHIVVSPAESEAGGWERYVVIVPTEKASPTVRVQVVLPAGMEVVAVEAKAGWQGVYKAFPIGEATVQWHAGPAGQAGAAGEAGPAGGALPAGRIPKGEFTSFEFLAWNPPAARTVSWVATQWYADESSDVWGGKDDSAHASTTVLRARAKAEPPPHRHKH